MGGRVRYRELRFIQAGLGGDTTSRGVLAGLVKSKYQFRSCPLSTNTSNLNPTFRAPSNIAPLAISSFILSSDNKVVQMISRGKAPLPGSPISCTNTFPADIA